MNPLDSVNKKCYRLVAEVDFAENRMLWCNIIWYRWQNN